MPSFMREYNWLRTPQDALEQVRVEWLAEAGRVWWRSWMPDDQDPVRVRVPHRVLRFQPPVTTLGQTGAIGAVGAHRVPDIHQRENARGEWNFLAKPRG